MTFEEFDWVLKYLHEEELKIGKTKGREYALEGDRLDNFKRIGKELNLNPKKVLWIYLKKHLDAIAYYIKTGNVYSEPIDSRILDARVYLSLLMALIEEKKEYKNITTKDDKTCQNISQ